jgi:AcrR family transcriptional regulator
MNDPARGRETRTRIQAVAVELFTEQGYDKTSLREIAERLNVTKAALYYHFKSKEDIVASLVEDYLSQVDDLIAWGAQQPRGAVTRAEILRRYVGIVTEGYEVFKMLHQNQAAINSMSGSKGRSELFRERLRTLAGLLSEPGASLADQLRPAMALGGISVAWMSFADQVSDRQALCAAVLAVASDMAGAAPPEQAEQAARAAKAS